MDSRDPVATSNSIPPQGTARGPIPVIENSEPCVVVMVTERTAWPIWGRRDFVRSWVYRLNAGRYIRR
jgi:hypothetical protein